MKLKIFLVFILSYNINPSFCQPAQETTSSQLIIVPLGGNAFKTIKGTKGGNISNNGIENWTDENAGFNTYVHFSKAGKITVWLIAKSSGGNSRIKLSVGGISREIAVAGVEEKEYYAGEWIIKDSGYTCFKLTGIARSGERFADVAKLKMTGIDVADRTDFVKDNKGNFFYWGRRGPSVHLNYKSPENTDAEWFYNEVTVPVGNDVVGSYFMANGFAEGYFGIQVNSPTERRILFSVWSPFTTDDPKSIPEDQKIKLLRKGTDVYTGEFGNEGSGGQSYLRFNWKPAVTYKFLLHGLPDGAGNTTYTAYFYAPEESKWRLIASFKRPQTNTYLKKLHSFLENFLPEGGDKERKVLFNNQWIRTKSGWIELNKAKFTGDNTARVRYRLDYAGGLMNNSFFLKNCGFFNDYTRLDSWFERPLTGKPPVIDFEELP